MLDFDAGRNVVFDSPVKTQAAFPARPEAASDREVKPRETAPKTEKVDPKELVDVANLLSDVARTFNRGLRFKVVGEQNRTVVQVIDSKTSEVIRSIPSEDAIAVKDKIAEVIGLLFDATE